MVAVYTEAVERVLGVPSHSLQFVDVATLKTWFCSPGLPSDETLRGPAGRPLYAQERRRERNGYLRVLYAARIGHCRTCPLREQCQESATTIKAQRVSAWHAMPADQQPQMS